MIRPRMREGNIRFEVGCGEDRWRYAFRTACPSYDTKFRFLYHGIVDHKGSQKAREMEQTAS